jgi:hypothetical protein
VPVWKDREERDGERRVSMREVHAKGEPIISSWPVSSSKRNWKFPWSNASRSISLHLQAQDFSRFAFDDNLERAAADLAIRCEALRGDAGVNGQVKGLAAEGALNGLGNLHESLYNSSPLALASFFFPQHSMG